MRAMGLARQRVTVAAPRGLCFEVVASAGEALERRPDGAKVVRFTTTVGRRAVPTIELVVTEPPERIRYSWLEGPLPEVNEVISFADAGSGTELVYEGSFRAGRGPIGWLYGRFVVKPVFERLVRKHLQQAKEVSERRGRRSHKYGRDTRRPRAPGTAED